MKKSAGLVLYRHKKNIAEILLVHPGGPYWKNKDEGSWSIPKGEFEDNEEPLDAAKRELKEETGIICEGPFIELPKAKQKSGKVIFAWATKKDIDASKIVSNLFEMEWPPKSGKHQSFPEVDRAEWFTTSVAKTKIVTGQIIFIDNLVNLLEQVE